MGERGINEVGHQRVVALDAKKLELLGSKEELTRVGLFGESHWDSLLRSPLANYVAITFFMTGETQQKPW